MKLIFVCSFLLLIFGVISGNATTEDECKAKCFVTHQASLKSIKECKKKCEEDCRNDCDPVGSTPCTSPCKCKPGYTGSKCDKCKPGYTGSKCDKCKPGYTGSKCDSCDYYANYKRVGSKCIKNYSNSCGYHGYSYMCAIVLTVLLLIL